MRHELFEYEGRISQLVKLVDIDVPQSIGVLNKILRRLEEYQSLRAADPQKAYDDVAMARAIWEEDEEATDATTTADGAEAEQTETQG
jgi:hypothetical protein